MQDDQDDIQLLQQIADGDEEAMTSLYVAYESKIYAYAIKKLNDSQAAADIVHEVMMAAWKGAGKFQGRSKVKSWLFGIAHNKIVDYIRKDSRYDSDELDEELPDSSSHSSEELMEAAQNRDFLAFCMEKLSDLHRQVVHLAFIEDLAYGEIADIIGVPEGTVKTRMFHAKQLLKKCLAGRMGLASH